MCLNTDTINIINSKINTTQSIYDIVNICKIENRKANRKYLQEHPTHKDLLSIFESAVSLLEINFINNYNESIVESALDDIEFIIGQNVLTESHIQRMLISPMKIQTSNAFLNKTKDVRNRITSLYNGKCYRYDYKYNEEKANSPFNYREVSSYLKYNKIGHEERLINQESNGDYILEHNDFEIDKDYTIELSDQVLGTYESIETINLIDMFKLKEHGLDPIVPKCYNNKDYFVHMKNGKYYNLYKSKLTENVYYMSTLIKDKNLKTYKISLKEKEIENPVVESTFILQENMLTFTSLKRLGVILEADENDNKTINNNKDNEKSKNSFIDKAKDKGKNIIEFLKQQMEKVLNWISAIIGKHVDFFKAGEKFLQKNDIPKAMEKLRQNNSKTKVKSHNQHTSILTIQNQFNGKIKGFKASRFMVGNTNNVIRDNYDIEMICKTFYRVNNIEEITPVIYRSCRMDENNLNEIPIINLDVTMIIASLKNVGTVIKSLERTKRDIQDLYNKKIRELSNSGAGDKDNKKINSKIAVFNNHMKVINATVRAYTKVARDVYKEDFNMAKKIVALANGKTLKEDKEEK